MFYFNYFYLECQMNSNVQQTTRTHIDTILYLSYSTVLSKLFNLSIEDRPIEDRLQFTQ
jgi:hypothetical protein